MACTLVHLLAVLLPLCVACESPEEAPQEENIMPEYNAQLDSIIQRLYNSDAGAEQVVQQGKLSLSETIHMLLKLFLSQQQSKRQSVIDNVNSTAVPYENGTHDNATVIYTSFFILLLLGFIKVYKCLRDFYHIWKRAR